MQTSAEPPLSQADMAVNITEMYLVAAMRCAIVILNNLFA
jgi:hypothetical protein